MNKDKYEVYGISLFEIRNQYETKVIQLMKKILPEYENFDGCSICVQDIYALSMSKIKPKYIQVGTIVLKREDDTSILEKAIRFAIDKVIENPNHT